MQVRNVKIRRFRGIAELDWAPEKRVVCLVGPNDSTKSTILDAIELALLPRWYVPFADTDFYRCDHAKDLEIEVTVGDLPTELLTDDRFGLDLRGWSPDHHLRDEPDDECEKVLTVRLSVGESLEPQWRVTNNRNQDGRSISWQDRARLGVARLGADTDRHLAWGRGSALARLTGDIEDASLAVAKAQRLARQAVASADMKGLREAATTAQQAAEKLGVRAAAAFCAKLDVKGIGVGFGALSLHEGDIPLTSAGLGTRRLVALALQRAQVKEGAIVLVDEVEHALEPHRLRRLIRELAAPSGQVIMTSHSATAVQALGAEGLAVVRHSADGRTSVQTLDSDFDATIEGAPEAALSRQIIVCEGKTEQGLCYAMDQHWSQASHGESFACAGVAIVDGGGANAVDKARRWATLGYAVGFVGDSDVDTAKKDAAAQAAGVQVIRWADSLALEERVCQDLPEDALDELLALAADLVDEQRVLQDLTQALQIPESSGLCVKNWQEAGRQIDEIRNKLGDITKKKGWFKKLEAGRHLGEIVAKHIKSIPNSDLAQKLEQLRKWVHGG